MPLFNKKTQFNDHEIVLDINYKNKERCSFCFLFFFVLQKF